ncbi:MAG: lipoyl(octanoyl) transferase LipB [Deltaproteobacteria bacterium]|nr:lipoyl(octanoyl) transferase LipB [Deltaproteobacteria bacterium]
MQRIQIHAYWLGTVDYLETYELQQKLRRALIEGCIGDVVLLLEHNPVITIGKGGNIKNILVSESYLASRGVPVVRIDRGGDVTFHNPGQIVGYFIVHLESIGKTIHQFVRALEEAVIKVLAGFKIAGTIDPKHPGVWIGDKKICALGLNVNQGVTMHGFALNVNNNLGITSYMHPCGLSDKGVTSIAEQSSRPVETASVAALIVRAIGSALNRSMVFHDAIMKPSEVIENVFDAD